MIMRRRKRHAARGAKHPRLEHLNFEYLLRRLAAELEPIASRAL